MSVSHEEKRRVIAVKEASKQLGWDNWLLYSGWQKRRVIAIKLGQPVPPEPVIVGHIMRPEKC